MWGYSRYFGKLQIWCKSCTKSILDTKFGVNQFIWCQLYTNLVLGWSEFDTKFDTKMVFWCWVGVALIKSMLILHNPVLLYPKCSSRSINSNRWCKCLLGLIKAIRAPRTTGMAFSSLSESTIHAIHSDVSHGLVSK